MNKLQAITGLDLVRYNPNEKIIGIEGLTVVDFWSWAYSVFSNLNRSVFAEFIVGSALGIIGLPRVEWRAYDFLYCGKKIDVKSAAYVQSWEQKSPSKITFDIKKKMSWDTKTNTYKGEPIRTADCYIFCLHPEIDRKQANIVDVSAWEFYVISTERIDKELDERKSIGLKRIQAMSESVVYSNLKERVDLILWNNPKIAHIPIF